MRKILDDDGVVWQVWEIRPEQLVRTSDIELLPRDLTGGWLAFESEDGRRARLAPYPVDWEQLSGSELLELCRSASPARLDHRGT